MSESKKLFLLDAYALIYRAYFAFIRNPRFNSKGLNTSAIFGFTNTLEEVLKNENPTHIAVVFDLPSPTFRHEIYADYKANREETPEDIRKAIPFIKEIVSAHHIPILEKEGYEADDVIGTIANKAEEKGFEVFLMTPDKDFSQLVNDNIFMYKPRRSGSDMEILDRQKICENYNIENPAQFIDILALWGDSSDNIPGAPGIGEKTAAKLIREFGSIENLIQNTDKLKGKQKENIENNIEQIKLSKILATIKTDAPVNFEPEKLKFGKPDYNALKSIYEELEFRNLISRLVQQAQGRKPETAVQGSLFDTGSTAPETTTELHYKTIETVSHTYHTIDTPEKRKDLVKTLESLEEFCFDTETTSLDPNNCGLIGISFSFKAHEAYYVPVAQNKTEVQSIVNEYKPVFENENISKTGQNIKFDMLVLAGYGIRVKGRLFDTMLAHYLIQPELRHNLNYLAEIYLDYSPVSIEELIGKKGKSQQSMQHVSLEKIAGYAAEDADVTWQLKQNLEKELAQNNLTDLFDEIEMPMVEVLAAMEKSGVNVDVGALKQYGEKLTKEAIEVEQEIYRMAGTEFNVASPKQLGEVLFDRMKISADVKKTKTKQYSTSEEELMKIRDKHPIVDKILEFRSLRKLLNTYVEALPKLINPKTGKIHTSFNQAITATGRLSSNNPNLQNIPIREERGREIRKAFIPSDEEHIILSADYSQIELRLMAHISQDRHMIEAFRNEEDIHTATAAKIYKKTPEQVTREMRSNAKTANFGIIYGISAFGLSQRLGIPRSDSKQLIDSYFQSYPKVKDYMDRSIRQARDKGCVETLMGRKRFLNDINSRNSMVRGIAERNAINTPIQGSAADIIKIAMIQILRNFEKQNLTSKMILQVHDELVFDVFKPELEQVKEIVRLEMQRAVKLTVPLTVDMGTGSNWLEAH